MHVSKGPVSTGRNFTLPVFFSRPKSSSGPRKAMFDGV